MEKYIIAHFELNVPKTAKQLAKFVSKDELRENLNYVCIEPGRGIITATDSHKLQVVNIEPVGEWSEGVQILVDPKHVAKIAGKSATVTVSDVEREVTRSHRVGKETVTESYPETRRLVEIEADGETYTTEKKYMNFPNVMRVIPPIENWAAISLTVESVEALKTICKLHKADNYVTFSVAAGDSRAIVCSEQKDYGDTRAAYNLELVYNAERDMAINLHPSRLLDCLVGCNGTLQVADANRPIRIEGDAEATILMPCRVNPKDVEAVEAARNNAVLVSSTFADDIKAVAAKLRDAAAKLWRSIKDFHTRDDGKTHFTPGNYSAKDIANRSKAKCGLYVIPDGYCEPLDIRCGNIALAINYETLFAMLADWESVAKCSKMFFSVGEVEEVTATVLEVTGEGADEKKMKLRKLGGHWYCDAKRTAKSYDTAIYYEIAGVIFSVHRMPWDSIDNAEDWQQWANEKEEQIIEAVKKQAERGSAYYSEVLKRIDVQQPATSTEMPQISTEATEAGNVSAQGESKAETAINEETRKYIIETYKTRENLKAQFTDAINAEIVRLEEYEANKRKGGKYRRVHIERLESRITLLRSQLCEWMAVFDDPTQPDPVGNSDYPTQSPTFAPQSAQPTNIGERPTPKPKRRQRENIRPKVAARKLRIRATIFVTSRKWRVKSTAPASRIWSPTNSPPYW